MGSLKERLDKKKKKKEQRKAKGTAKPDTELVQKDEMFKEEEEDSEKSKSSGKRKRRRDNGSNVNAQEASPISKEDKLIITEGKKKKAKREKKKRKGEGKGNALVGNADQLGTESEDGFDKENDNGSGDQVIAKTQGNIDNSKGQIEAVTITNIRTRKSKKSKKKNKKHDIPKEDKIIPEKSEKAEEDDVDNISSGDEDCSKGMKKWLTEYHQSRPGLKVLQQKIDEFITAHEEKLEQERKEQEARASEDGWTVVVHHKGRKKTADSESGITVGSVAPAVVVDKMAKKKQKEVGPDFYRFQRREAQRNEILMLQTKFEQDKKRIQQLRAARKFRPY